MEITLKDLWNILKKSFVLVVVGALVFGIVFCVYTGTAVKKVYRSSAEYVLVLKDAENLAIEQLNNYLVVGGKSIKTLSSYLMNEKTMEGVLRYVEQRQAMEPENTDLVLDHTYTPSSLHFSFSAPEEETDIVFGISCSAYSAKDARILMEAFGAIINERSEKVLMNVFSIDVSNPPKEGTLTSPNVMRNTMLGVVIGAVLPYVVCLLYTIFDTRIKKEEDIKKKFSYPILGQIPKI